MSLFRRYWGVGLIIAMVAVHAAIIGYIRTRLAQLEASDSTAVEVGKFRFQCLEDPSTVYQFRLHAVIDPAQFVAGRESVERMRMEIYESCEQLLRQAEPSWLADPTQADLRERLMEIVRKQLDQPMVQRMLITEWLELPVAPLTALQSSSQTPPHSAGLVPIGAATEWLHFDA